jgi:hypothetical protein
LCIIGANTCFGGDLGRSVKDYSRPFRRGGPNRGARNPNCERRRIMTRIEPILSDDATGASSWEWHMRQGDFAAAWEVCDRVLQARASVPCWHLPRHLQWVWRGDSLREKRVLIRCFHGLGDTVQFVRFAPLVRRIAAEVIVEAQPALLPLLETVDGIDRLVPLTDGRPDVEYDVEVEVMELPYVLRTSLATLPRDVPYVHANECSPTTLARRNPGSFAVGLVWAAGDWDPRRSIPIELLEPLAKLDRVEIHALQRGPQLEHWPHAWGAVSGSDDIAAAAGVMRALDLVITVDSLPAHLAGALGVPVWTLLHHAADWRWMDEREDSPWYPSMRLYRQPRPGDWPAVIARVRSELASMTTRS